MITNKLPKTLVLVGFSTLLALIISIPLGILQVVRRNKPIDYVLTGLTFIFYAMPAFLLGTLLILFFAIDLHWFPVGLPQSQTVGDILRDPRALVLPELTPGRAHHRLLQPLHALIDDGGHDRGLRPHCPGQRGGPTARPVRPRAAKRADPHPDPARPVDSRPS